MGRNRCAPSQTAGALVASQAPAPWASLRGLRETRGSREGQDSVTETGGKATNEQPDAAITTDAGISDMSHDLTMTNGTTCAQGAPEVLASAPFRSTGSSAPSRTSLTFDCEKISYQHALCTPISSETHLLMLREGEFLFAICHASTRVHKRSWVHKSFQLQSRSK